MSRDDALVDALDAALDALLAARGLAEPISLVPVPDLAVSACLARNGDYRTARAHTKSVLNDLRQVCDDETWALVLSLEAALNEQGALVSSCSFAVGMSAAWARR